MVLKLKKDKLKLWSAVCIISAIPSFYWATTIRADTYAMLVGVVLFIITYSAITSSDFYNSLQKKIFWFIALKYAFRVRVCYSLVSITIILLTITGHYTASAPSVISMSSPITMIDSYIELFSCFLTNLLLGKGSFNVDSLREDRSEIYNSFLPTLLTTIEQGILVSLSVLLVAIIIWSFLRFQNITSPNKTV